MKKLSQIVKEVERVKHQNNEVIVADDVELIDAIATLRKAYDTKRNMDKLIDESKETINRILNPYDITTVDAGNLHLEIVTSERHRFETNKFKNNHPDLYEEFSSMVNYTFYNISTLNE